MLGSIQSHIERIYGLELQVKVDEYLIDRETCLRLAGDAAAAGAVVVRKSGDDESFQVGVYIGEEALARVSDRLTADNLAHFCAVTEEVSHFAYLMWNVGRGRPVTQLELELQAEVDKFITSTLLLARQNRGLVPKALLDRLFWDTEVRSGLDPERVERYSAASAFARSYCCSLVRHFLGPARLPELLVELRRFYRLSLKAKIGHIYWTAFAY